MKRRIWLGAILVAGIMAPVYAQPSPVSSGESAVTMPEIQQPQRPSLDDTTGLMSGDKPFSLTVEENGELLYNFDPDTNELESITAKKGVVFTSEDMTLNSDRLDYNTLTSELIATGEKVVVRQGEVIATCQLFKYFPDDQHSELTGNPLLYNKTRDGKVTNTAGHKITIHRVNGKPQVKVLAGPRSAGLSSAGAGTPPNTMNVPPEGTNAVMSVGDSTNAPAASARSGASVPASAPDPVPVPAGQAPAKNNSVLGVPSLGENKPAGNQKPKSNRIDPDNPEDVKSLSGTRDSQSN